MVWKVSGSSGKLLAGLKVSVLSRKFLNSLGMVWIMSGKFANGLERFRIVWKVACRFESFSVV